MGHGSDQVDSTISIHVERVDVTDTLKIELLMKRPVRRARISWRLKPTKWSDDVISPVAVKIADSDTVSIAPRAMFSNEVVLVRRVGRGAGRGAS